MEVDANLFVMYCLLVSILLYLLWQPVLPHSMVFPCRTSLLVAGYSVLPISDWLGILLVQSLKGVFNFQPFGSWSMERGQFNSNWKADFLGQSNLIFKVFQISSSEEDKVSLTFNRGAILPKVCKLHLFIIKCFHMILKCLDMC